MGAGLLAYGLSRLSEDGSAWLTGDCSQHEMRGGSWFTAPASVSAATRNRFEEDYRSNSVGFRLVREIK